PLLDALIRFFHDIFEPWEENPRMAEAFMRARFGPGGERLHVQGFTAVEPVSRALFQDLDPEYAEDVMVILTNVVYAMVLRFAAGELPVTEIMPTIERTLRRLTGDTTGSTRTRRSSVATKTPSGRRVRDVLPRVPAARTASSKRPRA